MPLIQTKVTLKTADATLTYAEMGDIVVNSSSAVTLTLPTASPGLWYRISNVGSGIVTVGDIAVGEGEQGLCIALAVWYFSKGGGGSTYELTKAEIENVLTGEIDSHTHAAILMTKAEIESVLTGVISSHSHVGTGIAVLGLYATLTDLHTAHPTGSSGDAYAVGTSSSNVIYVWNTTTTAWENVGSMGGGGGGSSATTYTGTITTTWVGTEAPYSQEIAVLGMLATDNPFVSHILTGVYEDDIAIENAMAYIYRIVTDTDKITVYSHKVLNTAINLQLKVVR